MTISANRADAKNYCPRCDARLPRPTKSSSGLLIVGIVGVAVAVFCLIPAGLIAAWFGLRDRPAARPEPELAQAIEQPPAAVKPPPVAAAPGDGSLPTELLDKLKAATVFVKAKSTLGVSSGSGFVLRTQGDDAFIVTNHHVVADHEAGLGRKLPTTCQVVFNSGRRNEFTMPVAVLASDSSRDLAVLRVSGIGRLPNFPEALGDRALVRRGRRCRSLFWAFRSAGMLATGTENPAITIGKGTVSSLREDELGEMSIVQIDGDINPGNSGGPVVDREGRLIGITVAKIKNSNIGLAIPTDHLAKMLQGRLSSVGIEEVATGQAGQIELRVRMAFIDPFNRIRAASVVVAPADSIPQMPKRGPGGWETVAGQRYPLQMASQSASVTIPLTDAGRKRHLIQPIYSNGEQNDIRAQPISRIIAFDSRTRPPVSPKLPKEIVSPKTGATPTGKDQPIGEIVTKAVQFAGKKVRAPGKTHLADAALPLLVGRRQVVFHPRQRRERGPALLVPRFARRGEARNRQGVLVAMSVSRRVARHRDRSARGMDSQRGNAREEEQLRGR